MTKSGVLGMKATGGESGILARKKEGAERRTENTENRRAGRCRWRGRAAGVEFVRGQIHSTPLRFARNDTGGCASLRVTRSERRRFSHDAGKDLFGCEIPPFRPLAFSRNDPRLQHAGAGSRVWIPAFAGMTGSGRRVGRAAGVELVRGQIPRLRSAPLGMTRGAALGRDDTRLGTMPGSGRLGGDLARSESGLVRVADFSPALRP